MTSKVENPNATKPDGWTPIHLAVYGGHTKIVRFLASKVENFNVPFPDGKTPIQVATMNGNAELLSFLESKLRKPRTKMAKDPICGLCQIKSLLCNCFIS